MNSVLPLLLGTTIGLALGIAVGIRRNPLRHAKVAAAIGTVSVLAVAWIVVLIVGGQLQSQWRVGLPVTLAIGLVLGVGVMVWARRRKRPR
jgi:hypothetical protein